MILNNYVKTDTNVVKKKMMFLSPNPTSRDLPSHWVNDYLFEYDKIEKDAIIETINSGDITKMTHILRVTMTPNIDKKEYVQICRERMAKAKGVKIKCYKNGVFIGEYPSLSEVSRSLDIDRKTISNYIKSKSSFNGYTFEIVDGNSVDNEVSESN